MQQYVTRSQMICCSYITLQNPQHYIILSKPCTGLGTVKNFFSGQKNSEISGHFSGHQKHVFMLK